MKIVSEEHFERMEMMASYFEKKTMKNQKYSGLEKAVKKINFIIKNSSEEPIKSCEKIIQIINETEKLNYHEGSHWHDFKIHVNGVLSKNSNKNLLY
jgi:hypothetical protein